MAVFFGCNVKPGTMSPSAGIDPGTVVVSNRVYNAHLQENHNVVSPGRISY